MKAFGVVLIIVGVSWAVLGFANIVVMFQKPLSETFQAFGLIFNMTIFVLPGAIVAGLGALVMRNAARRGRKQHVETLDEMTSGQRKCPFCAELIKAEAKICRFCQRELPGTAAI